MNWMAWTTHTAVFFVAIGLSLVLMTIWEIINPTSNTRGFLPISTTRGDRFFISLLSAAFIHLCWLGVIGDAVIGATLLSIVWALLLMRWG